MTVRLGLVDSGVSVRQTIYVHASLPDDALPDPLGHGTAVCEVIWHHAPHIALYNAQVFDRRGVTTAREVAAAIDWLVAEKVDLINLSLGLAHDRSVLAAACERAVAANIILIASSPAQGAAVYPSSYDGVIRATGDARCDRGEISFLDSGQADFGGCPRGINPLGAIRGASMGAAHISGLVAGFLQGGGDRQQVREWLVSQAKYVHNECRT
ncbi:MAG: peptidase S8 and S53 subtilisin kexin sedolisin [Alphaproteobacteria bacterium]|nr:MAG: peptidase S8 and S53 subtilisin kexin sedolisin [Alphaproteobacteria bacterium]